MQPIGHIQTCFTEKFGVPRQSMMVPEARGLIVLEKEFAHPDTVRHLEEFSHLWVVYLFHKNQNDNHPEKWSNLILPPRVEAPRKVGVYASRSPHRPNPIGLSVVKLDRIQILKGRIELEVSGVDILDGSPVLDLKPYIPYADIIADATSGWIKNDIQKHPVCFSEIAGKQLLIEAKKHPTIDLEKLVVQTLEWDPRPRSMREDFPIGSPESVGKKFAFRILDLDIHGVIEHDGIRVFEIRRLS